MEKSKLKMLGLILASICLVAAEPEVDPCGGGNKWVRTDDGSCVPIEGNARPDEFPWFVGIEANATHKIFMCGGSLIHPRAVLTSAFCVDNASTIAIAFGIWDRRFFSSENIQTGTIHQVIVHKDYDRDNLYNNLAVIILSEPVQLNDHVGVVELPDENSRIDFSKCVSTGYGVEDYLPSKIHPEFIDESECRDRMTKHTDNASGAVVEPGSFCSINMNICRAKTGAPLVCSIMDDDTRYVQVGLLCWNSPNCIKNLIPATWTNIIAARPWIDKALAAGGIVLS